MIYLEARQDPPLSQIAVASVIINRSENYERTICSITHEKGQWDHIKIDKVNKVLYNNCRSIAQKILKNPERYDVTHGSLYFNSDKVKSWASKYRKKTITINHNIYYQ